VLNRVDHLALEMLVGGQTILDVAREVSAALDEAGVEGGIVGGIAVFLHGYRRTTTDIDVFSTDRRKLADALQARGFVWDKTNRQFEKNGIPVQLLAPEDDLGFTPTRFGVVDGIRAVTLGDLISMKLASGTRHVRRAQDIADIIRLADHIPLDKSFTPRVAKAYRPEFKRLLDDLAAPDDGGGRAG